MQTEENRLALIEPSLESECFHGPLPGCSRHALRCHGHSCSRQWHCGRAGVLGRGEPCPLFPFCFLYKGGMTTSCALTGRGRVSWDRMGQIRPNFIYYARHSVGSGHVRYLGDGLPSVRTRHGRRVYMPLLLVVSSGPSCQQTDRQRLLVCRGRGRGRGRAVL